MNTEKKFICDGMLGRLCRLLRMCGIDSAYCNEATAILVLARNENRIVLTKSKKLTGKQDVFQIEPDDPEQQLATVFKAFQLNDFTNMLSRCLECNHLLEPIDKPNVKGRVPFYIYTHNDNFYICPECQRIYWPGSHYKNMLDTLSHLNIAGGKNK